jgi:TRAP-type C4-dicarboxylate transport system permease large subunit
MKSLNMTFEEKSTWVSLGILLFVFTGYFSQVFEGLVTDTLNKTEIAGLFIGAVVTIVVLQIALHIVIAIFNVRDTDQPKDERDKLFAMKAGNISGLVLGIGVLIIAAQTILSNLNALWVANLLLFIVLVSQVVSDVLRLFYYRRGY